MTAPLLSVVVPAHDAAPWIEELLDSVLAQGVASLEVLVVDDRSTDGTREIVEGISQRDGRVRRLESSSPGGAGARNSGAAIARGEYLVFADADDIVPPGAYRSMLDSLAASGSDLVIGDHLKFSPTATWSPTRRWYPFDAGLRRTTLAETPALLTGRACWNRMFRRSFWEREGLRFPDVGHADDIVPMTRAVVRATAIDVVPDCVYLYRERGGGDTGSMSNRTDEPALLDYLREETACAAMVAPGPAALVRQQSLLVLDADGWVHIDRYVAQLDDDVASVEVTDAAHRLLDALDPAVLDVVAPERRCLFALLWIGEHEEAVRFARAVHRRDLDAAAFLTAWTAALRLLCATVSLPELDRAALVSQGLLTALLHAAEAVDAVQLVTVVGDSARLVERSAPSTDGSSEVLGALLEAVVADDPVAVRLVSELRRYVPLVVDTVVPDRGALALEGPADRPDLLGGAALVLRSAERTVSAPLRTDGARWSATVTSAQLDEGRWSVSVRVRLGSRSVQVPVVTARMPLPPLGADHLLQPLSDRRDGWRFLVDRRRQRSLLGRVRAVAARGRRSST